MDKDVFIEKLAKKNFEHSQINQLVYIYQLGLDFSNIDEDVTTEKLRDFRRILKEDNSLVEIYQDALDDGVDVSNYIEKYDPYVIERLFELEKRGISTRFLRSPLFSKDQFRILFNCVHHDESEYEWFADPSISYEKMLVCKKYLDKGISLKDYIIFDDDKFYLAADVMDYKYTYKKDYTDCLDERFSAEQGKEIFKWGQRNIRLGKIPCLEYYSPSQIREIGDARYHGIEIDKYISSGYSASKIKQLTKLYQRDCGPQNFDKYNKCNAQQLAFITNYMTSNIPINEGDTFEDLFFKRFGRKDLNPLDALTFERNHKDILLYNNGYVLSGDTYMLTQKNEILEILEVPEKDPAYNDFNNTLSNYCNSIRLYNNNLPEYGIRDTVIVNLIKQYEEEILRSFTNKIYFKESKDPEGLTFCYNGKTYVFPLDGVENLAENVIMTIMNEETKTTFSGPIDFIKLEILGDFFNDIGKDLRDVLDIYPLYTEQGNLYDIITEPHNEKTFFNTEEFVVLSRCKLVNKLFEVNLYDNKGNFIDTENYVNFDQLLWELENKYPGSFEINAFTLDDCIRKVNIIDDFER